jgi:hypothetical protein
MRGAMPNSTYIVKQILMAASLKCGCCQHLSPSAANQIIAPSNQIVSDPTAP